MFRVQMILNGIKSQLTGEGTYDLDLLEKEANRYQNDENSREILDGISELMFDLLSVSDQNSVVNDAYTTVITLVQSGKYEEAVQELDSLIKKVEKYKNPKEYDCDNDEQAIIIYATYQEAIAHSRFPFSKIYSLKAAILGEIGKYDEAIHFYDLAIESNPGNIQYYLERIAAYRLKGNLEEFYHANLSLFPYLCNAKYIAEVYRNLGYYLIEIKDYENAICALTLSVNYEETENAYHELSYIQHILQKEIDYPTMEQLEIMSEKYHIPLQLNENLLSCLYTFGMQYLDNHKKTEGKALIEQLYSVTKDEELLSLIK